MHNVWTDDGVTMESQDEDEKTVTCTSTRTGAVAVIAKIYTEPFAREDPSWLEIVKYIFYVISISKYQIFLTYFKVNQTLLSYQSCWPS